jgi:hypothetical protein
MVLPPCQIAILAFIQKGNCLARQEFLSCQCLATLLAPRPPGVGEPPILSGRLSLMEHRRWERIAPEARAPAAAPWPARAGLAASAGGGLERLAMRLFRAKLFKQTVAKCGTASPGFATRDRIVATLAEILRAAAFKCEMAADLAPSRPPPRSGGARKVSASSASDFRPLPARRRCAAEQPCSAHPR